MSQIAVVVRVTAAEGKRDKVRAVLGRLVEAAKSLGGLLDGAPELHQARLVHAEGVPG